MGIQLQDIIGLPPASYTNSDVIKASMPTLTITPSEPNFKAGFTLFGLKPAIGEYNTAITTTNCK